MLPGVQPHSPPVSLYWTLPAPSALCHLACQPSFAGVATLAALQLESRPQPELLQVPPVWFKETECDNILQLIRLIWEL